MKKQRLTDAIESNDSQTKIWKVRFAAAKGAYDTGKFKECESLFFRLLEQARTLTDSTFAINACHVGLGAVYIATGKLDQAKEQLELVINGLSGSSDAALREVCAAARRFYAEAMVDEGNFAAAEQQLRAAIETLEQLGDECAVPLSYALSDLAALYVTQGKLNDAKELLYAAMKLLECSVGSENPELFRAHLIYNICEATEEELLSQVEDGIQRLQYQFGSNHPSIKRALRWYLKKRHERGETDMIGEMQNRIESLAV